MPAFLVGYNCFVVSIVCSSNITSFYLNNYTSNE